MGTKIDVGGGKEPHGPSYINIDKYVTGPGIINRDMWDLPYQDGEVEDIWCAHTLEHASKQGGRYAHAEGVLPGADAWGDDDPRGAGHGVGLQELPCEPEVSLGT